jgi:hypothetical protein
MSALYLFDFGKVTYAPGAPKNAPRWVYQCACNKCDGGLIGPFRTFKEAKTHAEQSALAITEAADPETVKH